MTKAKTYVFTDPNGNRMIFPSMLIRDNDPDAPLVTSLFFQQLMICTATGLKCDAELEEFDLEAFPHVNTMILSGGFAHGGATVYLFAGPKFDEVLNQKEEDPV
jgi:hypothetical protein